MRVRNRQKEALPAQISLTDLGKAMSQLDLSTVPPHNRARAVMDHLAWIMSETVEDPSARRQLALAHAVSRHRGRSTR